MSFIHLHCHSNFSFLDGASSVRELVRTAAALNMPALALTDHNNVSAAVSFYREAVANGIKPIQGVEVTTESGCHLVLLAENAQGYAGICRLLTRAHLDFPRGNPRVTWDNLKECGSVIVLSGCRRGEIPCLILRGRFQEALAVARRFRQDLGKDRFFLELEPPLLPGSKSLNRHLAQLAAELDIGLVATNNVHYHSKERFHLQDLLTCVRTLTTLNSVHPQRHLHGEYYLKSAAIMAELFRQYPGAVVNTTEIASRCQPVFNAHRRRFPKISFLKGTDPAGALYRLSFSGARRRYGKIDTGLARRLEHELNIISALGFCEYFLLVWDVARYARKEGIRFAGRGSAADSVVAYCLGLTEVDAYHRNLLFERFMSTERAEQPDIDLDIDSRRRDKVAAYVFNTYGKDRVASVCTFNTYHARSAVRDLGKAIDLPEPLLDTLTKRLPHIPADQIQAAWQALPELRQLDPEPYRQLLRYCREVAGFPRFYGTHLGGLVISNEPLTTITPLQRSARGVITTQFDKEGVEDLGLVKLDLLSLKTMSAVEDATVNIRQRDRNFDYEVIPLNDKETFSLLNSGNTIGVFQLESPAQRALQKRLQANNMEDIVASLALIRPGPIKGNMVEPFIRRKLGEEAVSYLHPKLKPILEKTYGVVLFQEQVIEIATAIAGFTPGEADRLRKVMSHARSHEEMKAIGKEFIAKAVANGIDRATAGTIYSYIMGYASYGFCEAHAAAFSTTAYKTAYLSTHYPAEFFAAILSNYPMGYYSPGTVAQEVRRRGITLKLPDINRSRKKFTVEDGNIRVSLAQVRQMDRQSLTSILTVRKDRPFSSPADFCRRVKIPRPVVENLILCGAFDTLHPNRRELLWQLPYLTQKTDGMFTAPPFKQEIPDFNNDEKLDWERKILNMDVRMHLMARYRTGLEKKGILSTAEAKQHKIQSPVTVAGKVVNPHRPPTRSGKIVVFFSLEDEYGLLDVTMFEKQYQHFGPLIFGHSRPPLAVTGIVAENGLIFQYATPLQEL